jgi:hypothetical protein
MKTLVLAAVAAVAAFGIAGCGSTSVANIFSNVPAPVTSSTPATAAPVAADPHACTAVKDGKSGMWTAAQNAWLAAENNATDFGAVTAYAALGLDVASIAIDADLSQPTVADVATYNDDLSTFAQYLTGC